MKRRGLLKFGAGLAGGLGLGLVPFARLARAQDPAIREDTERWAPVIRASGARVE